MNTTASVNPTITTFMTNPHNVGASATGLVHIRKSLEDRFKALYQSKGKRFRLAQVRLDNRFFHVFVFPSESSDPVRSKIDYMSIIELNRAPELVKDLNQCVFRFATNFTGWLFSQAWIFKQTGMIIPEFEEYFQKAMETPPVTRNPSLMRAWDASSYYPFFYLCNMTKNIYLQQDGYTKIPDINSLKRLFTPPDRLFQ